MFVPSERVLDVQVWGRSFTRAELTAARRWRERERRRGNESKREEKRDRRGCMEIDKADMRDREREGHGGREEDGGRVERRPLQLII